MELTKKELDLLAGLENFGLTHEQHLWDWKDDEVLWELIEKIKADATVELNENKLPKELKQDGYYVRGYGLFSSNKLIKAENEEKAKEKHREWLNTLEETYNLVLAPVKTLSDPIYEVEDSFNDVD